MIYAKDMHIYDNYIENFRYKHQLEQDKKYKLPYMERHGFRRGHYLIDDKIEDVYLSTWDFRIRNIDNKRISFSVMEHPKSYAMIVYWWKYGTPVTKIYEELDHIPSWDEIERIVKSDF
ncbi:Uncharacterised protein [[Clostridium] sordellii]|uniref:hypothetical protein n=1 Tax=Paraclostridium sordellii TaxID=1505 RepID=UPI0005DF1BC4|nr:hypothetical protein [Paeniclostridium sordellii]CEQ01649.1 Uncharacterised protein [[Clostridium] sordellii] [Paeniclostridium sordellii]